MKKKKVKFLAKQIVQLLKESNHQRTDEDIFLTIDEVAKLISLSKYTIYGLVHKNRIPYHKKSRRLYFLKSEILDWLKSGKQDDRATLQHKVDEYLHKNRL